MGTMDTIKRVLIEGVFISMALVLSNYFLTPIPPEEITRIPAVDESFCNRIKKKKPDIVFIGNSILGAGFDPKQFTKSTGFQALKLTSPGSASAWWYVVIKNVVAQCRPKPKTLAIVFRDTFLTKPDYRVSGKYRAQINRFASEDEPVLDDLAYLKTDSTLESFLNRNYTPYLVRTTFKQGISKTLREKVEQGLALEPKAVSAALKITFSNKNYNPDLLTRSQLAAEKTTVKPSREFDDILERSFLPHIIAETEKADIQLILIRAKRRITVLEPNDSKRLTRYLKNLRAYLQSKGVPLWDYSSLSTIHWKHYRSGDHLGADGRKIFTDHVAADFQKFIVERH